MSVRIYQLSKEIGVDNSELIQILRSRGHDVKSASSTVDNISADSLREEFSDANRKKPQAEAKPVEEAKAEPENESASPKEELPEPAPATPEPVA
ncbi:MAG: translation initiation factor IF-2 N-terminal domain-containing protein, partial [Opitutales bacterium]|nr:translation initiation factor IF-2 N-terminal domain-containing protein [Opitutales bacterium]